MKRILFFAAMLCCCTIVFGQVNKKKKISTQVQTTVKDNAQDSKTPVKKETNFVEGSMGFDEGSSVMHIKDITIKEEKYDSEQTIFEVVEQMPQFPGGEAALKQWVSSHVKYPPIAEENAIQGVVVCSVVIETDGSISNVKVARSIDPSVDRESVRVIKAMPRWTPGRQNGKPVRVKFTIPVTFKLQ